MTVAVFLGDSVTNGTGATPSTAFFGASTGARLGWMVIQKGHPGETFASLLNDVAADVTANAPDVVVVQAGVNDVNAGKTPAQIAADAVALLAAIHAAVPAATLYVLGIVWFEAKKVEAVAADAAIVAAIPADVRWFGGWATEANKDAFIGADGVHPKNTNAHAYFGTRLAFSIRPPATGLV